MRSKKHAIQEGEDKGTFGSCKRPPLKGVGRWFPPGAPVSSTNETDISLSSSPPRYDPGCFTGVKH